MSAALFDRARRFGAAAACLALVVAGASAAAQGPARIGDTVEGRLVVGGKQIPLPEGGWVVAGSGLGRLSDDERPGAFGTIRNLVLFRLNGNEVDAAAEVNVNELPVSDGWGIANNCTRTDLALSVVRYKAGWDGSCFFVTHTLTPAAAGPAAWVQAMSFAAERRLNVPAVWLTAGFRVANRRDVIDSRMHFSPTPRGIAREAVTRWRDSAWAASRIERDGRRMALARSVTEWAVLFSGHMEAGIKNRIDPGAKIPMPATPEAADEGGVVERRLAALEDLHKAGVIGEEQYRRQASLLAERGLDPGSEVVDPATVALYKTLSYRPFVSFANVFIDYFWIGQPFAAGVLVFLQVTVNSTKFYFHELAWEKFVGGGTRRDSARVMDFVYVGMDS